MTHYQYWLGKVLILICETLWIDKGGGLTMKRIKELEEELETMVRK